MVVLWANIAQIETDGDKVREALENVVQAAEDGAESMRRLQRFAAPGKPGRQESVNLNAIVAECVEFTRPMWKDQAEVRDIYIEVKQDLGEVPRVMGNPAELREVVVNLVRNAVEAMPEGGTLTLRTYGEGDRACVRVRDTGIGIGEREMGWIFDPFYTTKGREGSGLGLSTVRSIVTAHGGEVKVQSLEGEGSTFCVALPASAVDVMREQVDVEPHQPRMIGAHQYDVLVVEDEPLVREALQSIFREQGHRVVVAGDGDAAMEAFRQGNFDIVLLDLGLPGVNGYGVAEEMKRLQPDVPILLVTGWSDDIDRGRIESLGILRGLQKPFRPQQLLRTVEEAMAKG